MQKRTRAAPEPRTSQREHLYTHSGLCGPARGIRTRFRPGAARGAIAGSGAIARAAGRVAAAPRRAHTLIEAYLDFYTRFGARLRPRVRCARCSHAPPAAKHTLRFKASFARPQERAQWPRSNIIGPTIPLSHFPAAAAPSSPQQPPARPSAAPSEAQCSPLARPSAALHCPQCSPAALGCFSEETTQGLGAVGSGWGVVGAWWGAVGCCGSGWGAVGLGGVMWGVVGAWWGAWWDV